VLALWLSVLGMLSCGCCQRMLQDCKMYHPCLRIDEVARAQVLDTCSLLSEQLHQMHCTARCGGAVIVSYCYLQ
jgi:hypothetical protein